MNQTPHPKQLLTVRLDLRNSRVLLLGCGHVTDLPQRLSACAGDLAVAWFSDCPENLPSREHAQDGGGGPGGQRTVIPQELLKLEEVGALRLLPQPLCREDLYGMDVVFSALSSSRINDELFAVCRTLGIRICILSQPQRSDFLLT